MQERVHRRRERNACGRRAAARAAGRAAGWATAAVIALAAAPVAQAPTEARTFDLSLRPVAGADGNVNALDVRAELTGFAASDPDEPFTLRAPIVYASVVGIADAITGLEVRDAAGLVPLSTHDEPENPAGYPYYREWRAERAVEGRIEVTYRARVPATTSTGPQFGILGHAGAFSSAGSGFLVLPTGGGDTAIRVRWEMPDFPAGSLAVTTFGDDGFELAGSPATLMQGYYMAGPVGRYPLEGTEDGFSAVWQGEPPFDPRVEMTWTAEAYQFLKDFFDDQTGSEFRVFVRVIPDASGNAGTALRNSFMLGTPPRTGDELGRAPRETLVHELVHHWATGLQGSPGGTTWFTEGLATHYARLLAMRAGLMSPEDYGRSVNRTVRGYYTSAARNLSADSIAGLGFSDGVARRMPYLRGSLYWADTDARIREATDGERGLDDILVPLLKAARNGEPLTREILLDALAQEIGADARAMFEAVVLGGATLDVAPDAFGPCFERHPTTFTVEDDAGEERMVEGFEWRRVPAVPDPLCRAW